MSCPTTAASAAGVRAAGRASRVEVRPARRAPAPLHAVKEVFMPALSSTMTEGKIVSWLKSEGDKLTKGEPVVVVESDKADMDVETFYDGILAVITVPDGSVASVGSPIAYIAETEADLPAAKAKAGGSTSSPAPAAAAAPPPPPPPPPPPAAPAAAAPAATAAPKAAAPPPPPPPPPLSATHAAQPARADGKVFVSPYAKKLAKELKVDLAGVRGSGLLGRVVAADIEAAAGKKPSSAPPAAAAAASKPAAAAAPAAAPAAGAAAPKAAAPPPPTGSVPLSGMQQAVGKNMLLSLGVPVSRIAMSMETDALDALYALVKPKGVTMTALLAKAVGVALAQHPLLFASLAADGASVTYNPKVAIAVAVALDGGLITPVLQDVAGTDLFQLGRQWKELVAKARAKTLTSAEFTTGNFTISNLGMYGVDTFDAILPPGQGAILAVGASKRTVVPIGDAIGVRSVMTLNLTADHRHINGDKAAEFMQTLKATIEAPDNLIM